MITTDEKFLFNMHVFDAAHTEPVEEDLPPVFTEDELLSAQKKSFEEGKKQGQTEEKSKRDAHVMALLASIQQNASALFMAEHEREKRFEQESVALSLALFEKIFPLMAERYGFAELRAALQKTLESHTGKQKITLFVQPDFVADIQQALQSLQAHTPDLSFTITQDPALTSGASRVKWDDGGTLRDIGALAQEITQILKETLAGYDTKSDDGTGARITEQPRGEPQ